MNRRLFVIYAFIAVTIFTAGRPTWASAPPYQPTKVYAGPYGVTTVYYRESFRAKWRQGVSGAVTCPDALSHFKVSGFWKGHLKLDGSCGIPDEPSEWAVGNRLNYEALIGGRH